MSYRPINVSWSQLRNWIECHQRIKLIRAGKKAKVEDQRVFFVGNVTDRAMRTWLADPDRRPGGMLAALDAIVGGIEQEIADTPGQTIRWKGATDRDEQLAAAALLLERLEPLLAQHVLPYEFQPAFTFKIPLEIPDPSGAVSVIRLIGEMDILVRQAPHRWAILDLKATRNGDYWRKTIGQLTFYALARKIAFGGHTVNAGLLQPLCAHQTVFITPDAAAERELFAQVVQFAHGVWTDQLPITGDAGACYFCPVKHACPKFTPVPGTRRVPFLPSAGVSTS